MPRTIEVIALDGGEWTIYIDRSIDVDKLLLEAKQVGLLKLVDVKDGDEVTFFTDHVYAVRRVKEVV